MGVRSATTIVLVLMAQAAAAHAADFSGAGCYLETPYGQVFEGQATSNPFTGSETWTRHIVANGKVAYVGSWSVVTFTPINRTAGRQRYRGGLLEDASGSFFSGSVDGSATFVRPKNQQGKTEISPPLLAKEVCSGPE